MEETNQKKLPGEVPVGGEGKRGREGGREGGEGEGGREEGREGGREWIQKPT